MYIISFYCICMLYMDQTLQRKDAISKFYNMLRSCRFQHKYKRKTCLHVFQLCSVLSFLSFYLFLFPLFLYPWFSQLMCDWIQFIFMSHETDTFHDMQLVWNPLFVCIDTFLMRIIHNKKNNIQKGIVVLIRLKSNSYGMSL